MLSLNGVRTVLQRKSSQSNSSTIRLKTKIGIIGAHSSGKTSLCKTLSNERLPVSYKGGIEIYSSFLTTSSECSDGKKEKANDYIHEIALHDIPREFRVRVHTAYESLILTSDCILLVCSLSDTRSFDEVVNILEYMKSAKLKKPVIVLANKSDIALKDEKSIKIRYGFYRYVSSMDHPCIEVSANNKSSSIDWWKTIISEVETYKNLRSSNEPLKIVLM